MKLPVQHTKNEWSEHTCRSPVTVLEALGIDCVCQDLGLWTFTSFPSVVITDSMTRYALHRAREFSVDLDAWHAFVAKRGETVLQAFDYTADFHSRDLIASHSRKQLVDLGVFGQGYFRLDGADIDDLSVSFAHDLEWNMDYFKNNPWRSGMYEEARDNEGLVSSSLQRGSEVPVAAHLDRPFWEYPIDFMSDIVDQLKVAEDEEVVFEERVVSKRKKTEGSSN